MDFGVQCTHHSTQAITYVQMSTSIQISAPVLSLVRGGDARPVLAKRIKDVLTTLEFRNGSWVTPEELLAAEGHPDVVHDAELALVLRSHPRIHLNSKTLSLTYRPDVEGVRDATELLTYIRDQAYTTGPVLASVLRKCYTGASADLLSLAAERRILVLPNPDAPRGDADAVHALDMMGLDEAQISQSVRNVWFTSSCRPGPGGGMGMGMTMTVEELQAAVIKAGLRSALAHQPAPPVRGEVKKKARRPRPIDYTKATNSHLPDLFTPAEK